MPLIAEGPAPAEPAGGGNCAKALPGAIRLASTAKRTSAKWPDMESSRQDCGYNIHMGCAFRRLKRAPAFSRSRLP
jgi:hypothetical protein